MRLSHRSLCLGRWPRRALLAGMGLVLTLNVAAVPGAEQETLPKAVTIGQLLRVVREKSPRVAAIRQRIEGARAEVTAAGVLPNPRLSYGRYDLTSRRNTMYDGRVQEEVTLEIPVLVAGQRGARVEAAKKGVEAAEAGVEADFAELAREVWLLFVKLLAGKQRIAILDETARDLDRLATIVRGREHAGIASPYDVLRIGIEAKGIQARLEGAHSDLAGTSGELGILLGMPGWKPEAVGELVPLNIPTDGGKLWADAEHLNPDIEAARRGEIAADAGLARARRERWPVPSLLVGTAFTDKPYGNTAFAGVSVELPLFDRGQGGMARAAADRHAAVLERELATSRARVALERAVDLLVRRRQTRVTFEREVLEKLPDLKAMGEAAYRLGKGTLLELLDASRSRTETRLTHLDLIQAEIEAELDALRASGLLVSTVETDLSK
jgi:cobalt-zinc-cadmium efflux system outer membrane protein